MGSKESKTYYIENHEAEICYEGEADLHKHYTGCTKNPGHVNFIPVNDFKMEHLPLRYWYVNILEVIKALAAITVLIKVKYTSLERPKYGGCLRGQYPFYDFRGRDVLRTGTGRVWHVVKHTESEGWGPCPCGKCQHSDTPSKVWGEVHVLTARHVVFDENEARQTRCVVGYDDTQIPGISLDGWDISGVSAKGDWCWFTCVSCDLDLLDELDMMRLHFNDLCRAVQNQYRNYYDTDNLAIIVSHPHGCPKQISIGRRNYKHKREGWTKYTRYWYTTCTCPGSSGALVFWPGFESWGHPHCGSNFKGNFCGESW